MEFGSGTWGNSKEIGGAHMKKLLSVFLTALVVCASLCTVYATDTISVIIVNPANGSEIENQNCNVELAIDGQISETVLEFDGEIIDGFTLNESMLTIGEHTLTAYAVSENGNVVSDSSTFTVIKSINALRLNNDFNDTSAFPSDFDLTANGVSFGNGINSSTTSGNIQVVRQSGKNWKSTVTKVEGPGGEGDSAYNMSSDIGNTGSSRPQISFSFSDKISTVATMEFDVNLNANTRIKLCVQAIDSANPASTVNAYLFDDSNKYIFDRTGGTTGTILGMSEFTYEVGKWYHVKMTFDIKKTGAEVDMNVSTKNDLGETITQTVLEDSVISNIKAPITRFTLDYGGGDGMGFSFDNVSVAETPVFTGINKIAYMYENSESEDLYPDASLLTAVKIYMNETIVADSLIDLIELEDESGVVVPLASISANDADNTLLLVPVQPLMTNTGYNVKISFGIVYLGEILKSDKAVVAFVTANDSYTYTAVDLKVGDTKFITSNQLRGNELSADIHFANAEANVQRITVVFTVRSGYELVAIDIANVAVPEITSDYVATLKTDVIPADVQDVTVQVMFLDNMTVRKPVFSTYEVKAKY